MKPQWAVRKEANNLCFSEVLVLLKCKYGRTFVVRFHPVIDKFITNSSETPKYAATCSLQSCTFTKLKSSAITNFNYKFEYSIQHRSYEWATFQCHFYPLFPRPFSLPRRRVMLQLWFRAQATLYTLFSEWRRYLVYCSYIQYVTACQTRRLCLCGNAALPRAFFLLCSQSSRLSIKAAHSIERVNPTICKIW